MKYQFLLLCCCTNLCNGSQLSTASASSTKTAEAAEEEDTKESLDKYEKEFIKKYENKEIAITARIPDDYFAPNAEDDSYEGLAALLTKERTVVMIPPAPLGKKLWRILKKHNIGIIEDPYLHLNPLPSEPPTIYWIAYTPASKNNALLLYYSHKARLLTDYAQLHLLGYKDDAIKDGYRREFEGDKVKAEDWAEEQTGTSSRKQLEEMSPSEWKQLEERFKSLDEDDFVGNGGSYLEGLMARKSDEEILKEYYNFFEQNRKEALAWIKHASAQLKLVP